MAVKRNSLSICALLFARLNANGTFVGGATGALALCGDIGRLRWTPDILAGDKIRETDGCGNLSIVRRYPDRLTGHDLEIEFNAYSHEMLEIATGAVLLTDAGASVGYTDPVDVSCSVATERNGVAIIAWGENWNCSSPNALPYEAHIFPKAFLVAGQREMTRGLNKPILTGYSEPNPNFGDGPLNNFAALAAETGWSHAEYDVAALPDCDAALDYISLPLPT